MRSPGVLPRLSKKFPSRLLGKMPKKWPHRMRHNQRSNNYEGSWDPRKPPINYTEGFFDSLGRSPLFSKSRRSKSHLKAFTYLRGRVSSEVNDYWYKSSVLAQHTRIISGSSRTAKKWNHPWMVAVLIGTPVSSGWPSGWRGPQEWHRKFLKPGRESEA